MTNDLIRIDTKFPECTAIDTKEWIKRVLGDELSDYESEGGWMMEEEDKITQYIEDQEGISYKKTNVDNIYNYENDFSDVFQFQIYYPEDADYLYSDNVYVAIEIHQGGDVRGNYGRVMLFKTDDLADSGFFDWVLGWHVSYANGEEVPENDRFSIGYSSHPFSEMQQHLKGGYKAEICWSERRSSFVAKYQDGRYVQLQPQLYI